METAKQLRENVNMAFTSLRLEVDGSIVNDIKKRFDNYADKMEEKLLATTQNLGHPAYGHSSSTSIGIDNLREETFDFLSVPKQ